MYFSQFMHAFSYYSILSALLVVLLALTRVRGRAWLAGYLLSVILGYLYSDLIWILGAAEAIDDPRRWMSPVEPLEGLVRSSGRSLLLVFVLAHVPSLVPANDYRGLFFSFQGRIARRHYWLANAVLAPVHIVVVSHLIRAQQVDEAARSVGAWVASSLWMIVVMWVSAALQAKRFHDRGKPGWMLLVSLIPIVGPFWSFVEAGCLRGTYGPNPFGPDPIPAATRNVSMAYSVGNSNAGAARNVR